MTRLVVVARERTRAVREPLVGRAVRASSARSTSATRAPRATARRSPSSPATSPSTWGCPPRAGARPHRRAAARHRQVRALRPRDGARRPARRSDWHGIRRHPDIGADLLKDIGVYGPVAEIVRAHHERIDGRGYPRGLPRRRDPGDRADRRGRRGLRHADRAGHLPHADELLRGAQRAAPRRGHPARRATTSRRWPSCCGRGTDYRHADEADFDRELDIERRMNEAVAPST